MQKSQRLARPAEGDPLLRAALASMPYGFSIWGPDRRLLLFNELYTTMYNLPPGSLRAGMSIMDISELTVAVGNHTDATVGELYESLSRRLDESAAAGRIVTSQRSIRGRVLRKSYTWSADLGWTIIHEDITEQAEREQQAALREQRLAEQNMRFTAAVESMHQGFCLFNSEERLVVCNEAYARIYDLPPALTQPGTTHADIVKYRTAHGMMPLEGQGDFLTTAWRKSEGQTSRVFTAELSDGRLISIFHQPTPDGGWVSTHQDVTEDRRRVEKIEASERELKVQNLRFDAAISNISHGLCMFDGEKKLVICNEPYARLYALPTELTQPGTLLDDILRYRFMHGMAPIGGPGAFVSEHDRLLAEGAIGKHVVEQEDGRTIVINHHPMPGGGWVATHQDVTEDRRRVAQIEASEREITLQKMRFEIAINNMSQGLCMYDKDQRLVVCNEQYARIYNLPPELLRPGTSLSEVLEYRLAHGLVPKQGRKAYIAETKRRVGSATTWLDELELADGRVIALRHHPMLGGGWVGTHEDVTEQRRIEARVRHLARHDALTDLPNRAFMHEHVEMLDARIGHDEAVAVLCLDLDHFKAVNDTLGHAVGDQVLIAVAKRLREAARESDIVARLGGDEFAIVLHELDGPNDAATIADRIVKSVARPIEANGHHISIATSVGIAVAPGDGRDIDTLLKNADIALYRVKSESRGSYRFFEKGMDEAVQHRRMLEQGLKVALVRKEFRLVYQPLLDLTENRVCCFEALLRWDNPERGPISPAEFIPVAEETGLINSIGEWVLAEACKTAATWPAHISVAVNLSPVQFKSRSLVEQIVAALDAAKLDPHRLEIEVTESLLLADTELTLQTLHRLRALGVRISMDDFGTGYSSLSYLRSFPFDKIKIDRSFMRDLTQNDESRAIIKAVIGLGQSLGMSTTAEGIETEEQLAAVRDQGCTEVQGFLFSPPLPASGAAALIGVPYGAAAQQPAARRKRG